MVINRKNCGIPSKRAIKFEYIRYNNGSVTRVYKWKQDIVKALDEAMSTSSTGQVNVKRFELNKQLETKHMECIVRAILPALGCERMKTTGWARVVETQRGNGSTA